MKKEISALTLVQLLLFITAPALAFDRQQCISEQTALNESYEADDFPYFVREPEAECTRQEQNSLPEGSYATDEGCEKGDIEGQLVVDLRAQTTSKTCFPESQLKERYRISSTANCPSGYRPQDPWSDNRTQTSGYYCVRNKK